MKKILRVVFIFSIMITLFGCNNNVIIEEDQETEQHDYISYNIWSHDGKNIDKEKYMDVQFTDVLFIPFTKSLTFKIEIKDSDYLTSDYYLITRKLGSLQTESQVKFRIASSPSTLRETMGYKVGTEIVIIKVNSRDLNPTTNYEPLATLSVNDTMANQRVFPEEATFYATNSISDRVNLNVNSPYVEFYYQIKDTKRLLTGLHLEVYYKPFNLVVATQDIIFTESMYDVDTITINPLVIDGLSPKTDYEIYVYLSGTDGVDNYENIFAFSRNATSTSIYHNSIIDAMPSLWAAIIDYSIYQTKTIFNYYIENDGKIKYQDEEVNIVLVVYNQTSEKLIEYPVFTGNNNIEIDNEYIKLNNYFQFEVVQTEDILTRYFIYF